MDNFKQSIPDKVAEWVLVRTKGYLPLASTFLGENYYKNNPFTYKHAQVLDLDEFFSFEACLKDPKLKADRYNAVKGIEHVMWMRKSLKESKLPQSLREYKLRMKKNN